MIEATFVTASGVPSVGTSVGLLWVIRFPPEMPVGQRRLVQGVESGLCPDTPDGCAAACWQPAWIGQRRPGDAEGPRMGAESERVAVEPAVPEGLGQAWEKPVEIAGRLVVERARGRAVGDQRQLQTAGVRVTGAILGQHARVQQRRVVGKDAVGDRRGAARVRRAAGGVAGSHMTGGDDPTIGTPAHDRGPKRTPPRLRPRGPDD